MELLCVGGPKDGQRITITESVADRGRFEVGMPAELVPLTYDGIIRHEVFTYDIVRLRDGDDETYRIAVPSGSRDAI